VLPGSDDDSYCTNFTVDSANASCGDTQSREPEPANDCNDSSSLINPGRMEANGDNVDENCDGRAGCYTDADNDGARLTTTSCRRTPTARRQRGLTADPSDCNDGNPSISPLAGEVCGHGRQLRR
jgi:hypothetical protein